MSQWATGGTERLENGPDVSEAQGPTENDLSV